MAKENNIVCLINEVLKSSLPFSAKQFIAIIEERNGELYVGEEKFMVNDDKSMQVYHKYKGSAYVEGRGYGKQTIYKQTADMSMIVIFNNDKIKQSVANIEQHMVVNLKPTITEQQLVDLDLRGCVVLPLASNTDILTREFPEIQRNTFPNISSFEIVYQIQTTYGAGCANLCAD